MAKGQKRSGRESRKPKKAVAAPAAAPASSWLNPAHKKT